MLTNDDFTLSDAHLRIINEKAREVAKSFGDADLQESQSIRVLFEFHPLGREVSMLVGNSVIEVDG